MCAVGFAVVVPLIDRQFNSGRSELTDFISLGAGLALGAWLIMFRTHWATYFLVFPAAILGAVIGEGSSVQFIGRGEWNYETGVIVHDNYPATYLAYFGISVALAAGFAGIAMVINAPLQRRRRAVQEQRRAQSHAAWSGPAVSRVIGRTADGRPVYADQMAPQQNPKTNTMAVLALVFGVMGGFLGIVFGHIALSQIKRTGEQGHGFALAGVILGYIGLAVTIAAFVVLAILLGVH